MIKIGKIILKYWYIFIFVILLLSGLFGYNLKNLHQEESENTWFSENDKTFKTYKYFLKEFNLDNFAVVAYNVDDFFTEESIEYQRYLISRFEKINYIEEVVGLTNANTIYSYNDELFIESIFNDFSSERINELINRIEKNPFIKGNLISNDYKTVAVYLKLINSEKAEKTYFHNEVYDDLCRILDEESTKKKIIFHTGGDVITDAEINKTLNKDLMILFPLSVLVSTIILFILFRNLISIITSNIIVVLSIVWTLGFKGLLNNPLTPLSPAILPLINVIAIATCIHLLSHFKLEYNNLNNKNDSLLNTFKKAGIPCFFTSLTTAIGFSSLVVSKISGIKYMGLFSAFGIMVSFILAIILIPLSLKISKIKINNKLQKNYISNFMNKLLKIILKINLKYSLWILIFAFIILIIMFLGIFKINVQSSMIHYLKKGTKYRKDVQFLDERLTGISSLEILLYGKTDEFKDPLILKKIESFQKNINSLDNIIVSYSAVDYLKLIYSALNNDDIKYYKIPNEKNQVAQSFLLYEFSEKNEISQYISEKYDLTRISIKLKEMSSKERLYFIKTIQDNLKENFNSMKYEITGFEQLMAVNGKYLVFTQIASLGLAFGIILIIMIFLFGIKGGLVSIIPNIFPIVILLGIIGFFRFNLNLATSIIASIAIGIVVDDTIHYFYHYRFEMKSCNDNELAMQRSLMSVGKALCFTSLVLVLGYLIFLFSRSKLLIDYGLLSGIAIIFALLGDLFIGPILLTKWKIFKKK